MANHWIILSLIAINIAIVSSAYCNGRPGQNVDNNKPIWDEEPRLIGTVKYGKLFQIGSPEQNNTMYLIHLWGTNYQRG